jgi:hypothetical protein
MSQKASEIGIVLWVTAVGLLVLLSLAFAAGLNR